MEIPGFLLQKTLGTGSYGTVYKAKRISDGNSYAVKVIDTSKLSSKEVSDALNEIRIMASFNSPYLISFCEAFCSDQKLFIVTEYARLGDLSHLCERRKKQRRMLKENDIWRFLIQLLEGLKVLHDEGVVHRDIKSANILLCAPDLVKIGDLGISTVIRSTRLAKTQIGTPLYLAPEVWRRQPYDERCDMWSLGVLLFEMMTFSYPFTAYTTEELARKVVSGKMNPISGSYSGELQTIVRRLLQVDPKSRPSVDDLLESYSIKRRLSLVSSIETIHSDARNSGHLLQTIKLNDDLKNIHMPSPAYEQPCVLVRPLEKRINVKGGNVRTNLEHISTYELQMLADFDWWTPKKQAATDENHEIPNYVVKPPPPPISQRPALMPMWPIGSRPSGPQPPRAPRMKYMCDPFNPRNKRLFF